MTHGHPRPIRFCLTQLSRPRRIKRVAQEGHHIRDDFVTGCFSNQHRRWSDCALISSELLDRERRSSLLGRIDVLIVPAWNIDTGTFDHTIQTLDKPDKDATGFKPIPLDIDFEDRNCRAEFKGRRVQKTSNK